MQRPSVTGWCWLLSQKFCQAGPTACQHDGVTPLILQGPAVSVTLPRWNVSPRWVCCARASLGWSSGSSQAGQAPLLCIPSSSCYSAAG